MQLYRQQCVASWQEFCRQPFSRDRNQPSDYINSSVSFLSKIIFVLRTVVDGFFGMKNVCDIVRRFEQS